MNETKLKDSIAHSVQVFREFEKDAEEMAIDASERLGMKITKKDVMYAWIEVLDTAKETNTPIEDLLFDACKKMDKEDTHDN